MLNLRHQRKRVPTRIKFPIIEKHIIPINPYRNFLKIGFCLLKSIAHFFSRINRIIPIGQKINTSPNIDDISGVEHHVLPGKKA